MLITVRLWAFSIFVWYRDKIKLRNPELERNFLPLPIGLTRFLCESKIGTSSHWCCTFSWRSYQAVNGVLYRASYPRSHVWLMGAFSNCVMPRFHEEAEIEHACIKGISLYGEVGPWRTCPLAHSWHTPVHWHLTRPILSSNLLYVDPVYAMCVRIDP